MGNHSHLGAGCGVQVAGYPFKPPQKITAIVFLFPLSYWYSAILTQNASGK